MAILTTQIIAAPFIETLGPSLKWNMTITAQQEMIRIEFSNVIEETEDTANSFDLINIKDMAKKKIIY